MNFRNAKALADGRINCEIEHPVYGWIPFTADPNDTGAGFDVAELFAQLVPVAAPPSAEDLAAPVPASVSRFQAKAALALAGKLTAAEAAVTASGSVVLQLAWAEANDFRRDSPGINALAPMIGLDAAGLDALFIAAAQIEA